MEWVEKREKKNEKRMGNEKKERKKREEIIGERVEDKVGDREKE